MLGSIVLIACIVTPTGGIIAELLGGGEGRTSYCSDWSRWEESECFSTNSRIFLQHMPGNCFKNIAMRAALLNGRGYVNRILDYFGHMNRSAQACGMCNVRISCASACGGVDITESNDVAGITDEIKHTKKEVKQYKQVCTELEGYDEPCVTHKMAYNYGSQTCHTWPPRERDIRDFLPVLFIPGDYARLAEQTDPFNCVSVDTRCYCCCAPFVPDPCTAKCTLSPCTNKVRFRGDEIVKLAG